MSTCRSPVGAGVALDEMERRILQLFLHVKQEGVTLVVFLLHPGPSPATIGYEEEQHIHQ